MKNQIFITVWIITIAVAVFFGLSSITISQVQNQRQTQSQIQAQHNSQITIVDTSRRYTNIVWIITNFSDKTYMKEKIAAEGFINGSLDFYQQREVKISQNMESGIIILYPVFNVRSRAYTNSQDDFNSNYNKIKFNVLKKVEKLRK
jgi:hypothetical protein